jgi:DNA-binding NtrC family response regulator
VIAATNQNLEERVRRGTFRKDLYYRLAVVEIHMPPLRERAEDIPLIARQLLDRLGREMGKPRCHFDQSAMESLVAYSWPGNVRELRNVIEHAVMLVTDDTITAGNIRRLLPSLSQVTVDHGEREYASLPYMEAKEQAIADFTTAYLRRKLAMHSGIITKAAESSGIPRQHFSSLMKRYLPDEQIKSEE